MTPSSAPSRCRTVLRRATWLRGAAALAAVTLCAGGLAGCDASVLGAIGQTTTTTAQMPSSEAPGPSSDSGAVTSPSGSRPGHRLLPRQSAQSASNAGQAATAAPGVLLIDSTITAVVPGGASGTAAGTGMVLTDDGYALTNYHVVEGSSTIQATIADTGKTFTATVVGADEVQDVAVLKLADASGLTPVRIDRDAVSLGDAVSAVGNGGGQDKLHRVNGVITATDDQIAVAADGTARAESLSGLLRTDADVVPGYSGGPLMDRQGEVLGMTTAASTGSQVDGYAIPIARAVSVADQIRSGRSSGTVRVGARAALGVVVTDSRSASRGLAPGALVQSVTGGGAASSVGLLSGDVITVVGGTSVSSSGHLSTAMSELRPGQRVSVTWVTAGGSTRSAQVTLGSSPVN